MTIEFPDYTRIIADHQAHFIKHFAPSDLYEREQFHRELAYLIQLAMNQAVEPFIKQLSHLYSFHLPGPQMINSGEKNEP